MDHEAEVRRGEQAKELIEHPLMVEAFDLLRTRMMDQWADSPARDSEGREKLWQMTKLLDAVESHLKETLQTGKLAQIQLNQTRSMKEKAQEWIGGL